VAPTIVIALCAWGDAIGWRKVITPSHVNGLSVSAAHNPKSSLEDDVDAGPAGGREGSLSCARHETWPNGSAESPNGLYFREGRGGGPHPPV
jgi:hypothetical protein